MEFGTSSAGSPKRVARVEAEGVGKVEGEKREPVKPEKFHRGEMLPAMQDTRSQLNLSPHLLYVSSIVFTLPFRSATGNNKSRLCARSVRFTQRKQFYSRPSSDFRTIPLILDFSAHVGACLRENLDCERRNAFKRVTERS